MIPIKIKVDSSITKRRFTRLEHDQLPFALSLAVNRTAQRIVRGERKVMIQRFDRPTRFTLNSLLLRPSSKADPEAEVWFRDFAGKGTPAMKYLNPEVYGGERRRKRSENALIAIGAMRPNEYAVPGPGARLDAHGNMSRGQIVQILSALKAFSEVGYQANRTQSRRSQRKRNGADYFAGNPGNEGRGVWQRVKFASGDGVRPVLLFVQRSPRYRIRLPFHKIAANIACSHIEREFIDALSHAVATARDR